MRAASEYKSSSPALNPASDRPPEIPLENVLIIYQGKISLARLQDLSVVLAAKAQAEVDSGRIILAEAYWQQSLALAQAIGAARRNSR